MSLSNVPVACNAEAKVIASAVRSTIAHLKNKDETFLFVGRQSKGFNVCKTRKLVYTGYDKELDQNVYIYETKLGRLFVGFNEKLPPNTIAGFYSCFLPFAPSPSWMIGGNKHEKATCPPYFSRWQYTEKAFFHLLKNAKTTLKEDATIRLLLEIAPAYYPTPIDVKLKDVILDEKKQKYKLNAYTVAPQDRKGFWKKNTHLTYEQLLNKYALPVQTAENKENSPPPTQTEKPKISTQPNTKTDELSALLESFEPINTDKK
jgi:hypothetical protein